LSASSRLGNEPTDFLTGYPGISARTTAWDVPVFFLSTPAQVGAQWRKPKTPSGHPLQHSRK